MFRMLQISDPHLGAVRGYGVANFDAVARAAAADPPDLVVGSGDLALDDPDDAADRRFARACFDALPVRWRAVPGNHDIGDTLPDPWLGEPVTAERRERWVEAWGPDWWLEEAEAWLVVGLDSLLFASGLAAETAQWEWLAGVAAGAGDRPVMLVLHKPLCGWSLDETDVNQRVVTPAGRRLLLDALGGARVRLVASGHVHQYRGFAVDGLAMVWAPSTAFVSKPGHPSQYGALRQVGAVSYRFEGRGVAWTLLRPPALVDHDVAVLSAGAASLRDGPPDRPRAATTAATRDRSPR